MELAFQPTLTHLYGMCIDDGRHVLHADDALAYMLGYDSLQEFMNAVSDNFWVKIAVQSRMLVRSMIQHTRYAKYDIVGLTKDNTEIDLVVWTRHIVWNNSGCHFCIFCPKDTAGANEVQWAVARMVGLKSSRDSVMLREKSQWY